MLELPDFSPLRITQDSARPSAKQFEGLDHVVIALPEKPSDAAFRGLPAGARLKRLFDDAGKRNLTEATLRLDNKRGTAVTLSQTCPGAAFEMLTWARKLTATGLATKPGKIGVMARGFDDEARDAVLTTLVRSVLAASFELPRYKSEPVRGRLTHLRILSTGPRLALSALRAEALGNNAARWFTALPPNELTAVTYRQAIEQLAGEHGLEYEFIGEAALEKLGAGAFLAVSQGNEDREAGIVRLRYRPDGKANPALALVGKGILFDTGGTNLKPFKGMLEMHTDMQGSAVALGTALALARVRAGFAFDVWLAITPNRISSTAYTSQYVVRACNGTTIQVIHTDAEGRMVLADTLALAARERPALIIDYATLTGACVSALTTRYSGVFTNRPAAHEALIDNGRASGERVWAFPMDADFEDPLRSEVADIKQCAAEGFGDHLLAARFLKRFVPDSTPWIHMDLSAGQHKGGLAHIPTEITGFGVRYTLELLLAAFDGPAAFADTLAK